MKSEDFGANTPITEMDFGNRVPRTGVYQQARDEASGLGTPFVIKDSGKRAEFSGGMVRDIADDKIDYSLITDGPMFKRWAVHLTNGAKKYAKRNWMKAEGEAEKNRFKESAFRHFMQWYFGEVDEDHASAVYFNINGFEYVKGKTGVDSR